MFTKSLTVFDSLHKLQLYPVISRYSKQWCTLNIEIGVNGAYISEINAESR